MIDAARSDTGVAAACLLAFRHGEHSDEADAGAVILADAIAILRAFSTAYLKRK